jgi:hypothetical protein
MATACFASMRLTKMMPFLYWHSFVVEGMQSQPDFVSDWVGAKASQTNQTNRLSKSPSSFLVFLATTLLPTNPLTFDPFSRSLIISLLMCAGIYPYPGPQGPDLSINFMQFNCNGLYSSRTELQDYIVKHQVKIITLQETKLNARSKLSNFQGFNQSSAFGWCFEHHNEAKAVLL